MAQRATSVDPETLPKKTKAKTKEHTKSNNYNKTNRTKTKTQQNKQRGFRVNKGPPHLTLKPSKKKKTKETKNKPKKTRHITHKQTQETQNNKKQKPEHSNLICETTTTTTTREEKKTQKFKNNKRKGQHKRIRVLKANAKRTLKTCRKIVSFWNITSELLKQNLIEDIKNTNVHN